MLIKCSLGYEYHSKSGEFEQLERFLPQNNAVRELPKAQWLA
jgi:hypothetical protein